MVIYGTAACRMRGYLLTQRFYSPTVTLELADRHERQNAGGDDWCLLYLERTAPGGTAVRFDGDT